MRGTGLVLQRRLPLAPRVAGVQVAHGVWGVTTGVPRPRLDGLCSGVDLSSAPTCSSDGPAEQQAEETGWMEMKRSQIQLEFDDLLLST